MYSLNQYSVTHTIDTLNTSTIIWSSSCFSIIFSDHAFKLIIRGRSHLSLSCITLILVTLFILLPQRPWYGERRHLVTRQSIVITGRFTGRLLLLLYGGSVALPPGPLTYCIVWYQSLCPNCPHCRHSTLRECQQLIVTRFVSPHLAHWPGVKLASLSTNFTFSSSHVVRICRLTSATNSASALFSTGKTLLTVTAGALALAFVTKPVSCSRIRSTGTLSVTSLVPPTMTISFRVSFSATLSMRASISDKVAPDCSDTLTG